MLVIQLKVIPILRKVYWIVHSFLNLSFLNSLTNPWHEAEGMVRYYHTSARQRKTRELEG